MPIIMHPVFWYILSGALVHQEKQVSVFVDKTPDRCLAAFPAFPAVE